MSDDKLGKAKGTGGGTEPSRWHTNTPGHIPSYSTHKMRAMAAAGFGEAGAMQREVARMSRTQTEDPTARTPRVVITLQDVTQGLGLSDADEQRLQGLVSDTLPTFTQKTQTQRIMHARSRLQHALRDSMKHIDADTRMEVLRRAVAYWKRNYQTDYGKTPTVRFRGGEQRKSMQAPKLVIRKPKLVVGTERLEKAGPFIGPKGGKWADAKHTIPWKEGSGDGNNPVQREMVRKQKDKSRKLEEATKAHILENEQDDWDRAYSKKIKTPPEIRPHTVKVPGLNEGTPNHKDILAARKRGVVLVPRNEFKQAAQALQHNPWLRADRDSNLHKAVRGGKYYRRVPNPRYKGPGSGTPKWKYYYTREQYEREHGTDHAHISGRRAKKTKAIAKLKEQLSNAKTVKNALDQDVPVSQAQRFWVKGTDFGLPSQTVQDHVKRSLGKNEFGEPVREYTKERQQLHDELVAKATKGVRSVPEDKKPVAIVMMGGGGAGKGTLINSIVHDHEDFVHVDPDEVKQELPEYKEAMNITTVDGTPVTAKDAAWMAHEESGDVAEKMREKAMDNRQNMILDGTGKNAQKYADKIKKLKEKGYHVRLMYAHTDMDEAVSRAAGRADRSGRYVPHEVLQDAHMKIPGNFEYVARHADDFHLFESKKPPDLLWSGGSGKPDQIHKPDAVKKFQSLGKRLHNQLGIKLPDPQKAPAKEPMAASMDAMQRALAWWEEMRKASDKDPDLDENEMLRRIRENSEHYPNESSNVTEGSDELLKEHADKVRQGETLKKAVIAPRPISLEWK